MMNYLEKVCFFLLFAELIAHLISSQRYERYMRMLIGLICIVILVLPIGNLLFYGDSTILTGKAEEFERELKESLNSDILKNKLEELEQVQSQEFLVEQTEDAVKEIARAVANRYKYGIRSVAFSYEEERVTEITVILYKEQEAVHEQIQVEKVVVGESSAEQKTEEEISGELEQMKEEMAKEMGIHEDFLRFQME